MQLLHSDSFIFTEFELLQCVTILGSVISGFANLPYSRIFSLSEELDKVEGTDVCGRNSSTASDNNDDDTERQNINGAEDTSKQPPPQHQQ